MYESLVKKHFFYKAHVWFWCPCMIGVLMYDFGAHAWFWCPCMHTVMKGVPLQNENIVQKRSRNKSVFYHFSTSDPGCCCCWGGITFLWAFQRAHVWFQKKKQDPIFLFFYISKAHVWVRSRCMAKRERMGGWVGFTPHSEIMPQVIEQTLFFSLTTRTDSTLQTKRGPSFFK